LLKTIKKKMIFLYFILLLFDNVATVSSNSHPSLIKNLINVCIFSVSDAVFFGISTNFSIEKDRFVAIFG